MAEMPWEHAAEARAALNAIVTDPEHGAQVLSSPKTMSNLLKDLLPDAPREKNLLVAAAEAGLADALREHVSHGMDPSTAIRLTASSFSASTPLTPEACSWVTSEIAAAMGISSPAGSAQAAESGPAGSYSNQAPRRDYAIPPGQRVDSAAGQGPGQAPGGTFGQVPAPGFGQSSGQPAAQFSPPPFEQSTFHPQGYSPGYVAAFQQSGGYRQSGYQPGVPAWPAGGYPGPKTNGLAIAALICGVAQFLGFWLLGTIPAIVLGHMARNQIRQRNEQGAGLALAGLILGYVGIALTVIVVIIIIIAANSAPFPNY